MSATPKRNAQPRPRMAPTAARALGILELLASDPLRSYTQAEIRRRLGYSHGNLHAILATMEATGHVRRDPTSRSYTLGPALLVIGDMARRTYPSVQLALPHMEALATEFDTECHAGARVGDSILIVARVGPPFPIGYGVSLGQRVPITPPIGSSFISWSSEAEIEAYLNDAADDLSSEEINHYRIAMATVRSRGYSVHVDNETRRRYVEESRRAFHETNIGNGENKITALTHELAHTGYLIVNLEDVAPGTVLSVSSPVFGLEGTIELTVGISFMTPSMTARPIAEVAERLLATTRAITRAIGGRPLLEI